MNSSSSYSSASYFGANTLESFASTQQAQPPLLEDEAQPVSEPPVSDFHLGSLCPSSLPAGPYRVQLRMLGARKLDASHGSTEDDSGGLHLHPFVVLEAPNDMSVRSNVAWDQCDPVWEPQSLQVDVSSTEPVPLLLSCWHTERKQPTWTPLGSAQVEFWSLLELHGRLIDSLLIADKERAAEEQRTTSSLTSDQLIPNTVLMELDTWLQLDDSSSGELHLQARYLFYCFQFLFQSCCHLMY
jgi:hypothetical protein